VIAKNALVHTYLRKVVLAHFVLGDIQIRIETQNPHTVRPRCYKMHTSVHESVETLLFEYELDGFSVPFFTFHTMFTFIYKLALMFHVSKTQTASGILFPMPCTHDMVIRGNETLLRGKLVAQLSFLVSYSMQVTQHQHKGIPGVLT